MKKMGFSFIIFQFLKKNRKSKQKKKKSEEEMISISSLNSILITLGILSLFKIILIIPLSLFC